ncbi:hypothetical protein PTKIN_Ptkin11bG0059700 [Pterospermum kingtungense]
MSSVTPRNNPSKPVVVRRVPTFSFKSSNSPGLGHDEDDQVMLGYKGAAGYKLEDSCSNVRLQGSSVLVGKGHGGDGNEVEGLQKDAGRERLKRHREEVAAPNGLASARKALMAEGRRTGSQRLRIGNLSILDGEEIHRDGSAILK